MYLCLMDEQARKLYRKMKLIEITIGKQMKLDFRQFYESGN